LGIFKIKEINKIIKLIISSVVVILAIFATIVGALAFDIDANDSFVLFPGEEMVASFVIINYPAETMIVETDSTWISFDEDEEVFKKNLGYDDLNIKNEALFVQYYIKIPKNTGIGVYKSVLTIKDSQETKVVNVKMNVQNELISNIYDGTSSPNFWKYLFWGAVFSIGLFVIVLFSGEIKNAKK